MAISMGNFCVKALLPPMMTLLFSFLSHSRGSAVATRGASWAAPAPSSAPGGPGLSRTEAPDTTTSSQTTQIIGYEEEGEKSLKKWNHVSLVFFPRSKRGGNCGKPSFFVRAVVDALWSLPLLLLLLTVKPFFPLEMHRRRDEL